MNKDVLGNIEAADVGNIFFGSITRTSELVFDTSTCPSVQLDLIMRRYNVFDSI